MTLTISSWHKADRGNLENVHELTQEQLAKRDIIYIDIANDPINPSVSDQVRPSAVKFMFCNVGRVLQ